MGVIEMTMKEANETYQIPLDILKQYEKWNLCKGTKKVTGMWQYDDGDLERLGTIVTLYEIGFSSNEVEQYMRLSVCETDTTEKRMQILTQKREQMLDKIHFYEKRLEQLDYLRYSIDKITHTKYN